MKNLSIQWPAISNQRTLSLSNILLTQMERQLKQWQETLLRYSNQLMENNVLFNTIGSDSILRILPSDSKLRVQYISQIELLSNKWVEADTVNKANLYRIAYLQNRVSMNFLKVSGLLDIIKSRMHNYSQKIFEPEFEYLFSNNVKGKYDVSLFESLRKSVRSNYRVFIYFSLANLYRPLIYYISWFGFFLVDEKSYP